MTNDKFSNARKIRSIKSKKGRRHATIMLASITFLVWLIMLIIKYFVSGCDFTGLFDDIVANILGILPPIIIFNFAFEYLTQDYVSEEISEQITHTLMSDTETIDLFKDQQKRDFLKATLLTIVGEEECEMIYNILTPYLDTQYNLKKFFRYNIVLREYPNQDLFDPNDYIKVCENLTYKKVYLGENTLPPTFRIGFFMDCADLDKELRENTYLFRENLAIKPSDLERLIQLPEEEQREFVINHMSLKVFIDNTAAVISKINIDKRGIDVEFISGHSLENKTLHIEILFYMPQLRNRSEFMVSITEPTYSPLIQLSYPESLSVNMYPFLNNANDCLVTDAMHNIGTCDIYLQDRWVYPISGIVFIIENNL